MMQMSRLLTKKWQISIQTTPGVQNKGFKGLPKEDDSEINLNPWLIIGGLAGIIVLVGLFVFVSKKKRSNLIVPPTPND